MKLSSGHFSNGQMSPIVLAGLDWTPEGNGTCEMSKSNMLALLQGQRADV